MEEFFCLTNVREKANFKLLMKDNRELSMGGGDCNDHRKKVESVTTIVGSLI